MSLAVVYSSINKPPGPLWIFEPQYIQYYDNKHIRFVRCSAGAYAGKRSRGLLRPDQASSCILLGQPAPEALFARGFGGMLPRKFLKKKGAFSCKFRH